MTKPTNTTTANSNTTWEMRPGMSKGKKKWYSEDDLIDAFLNGKKTQKKENNKTLMETFSRNIEQAKNIIADFYKSMTSKGIECHLVTLRPFSITQFDAIYIVDEEDFISDDFETTYDLARKLCLNIEKDTFNLSFSFMPYSKNINNNKLLTDGYVCSYDQ